MVRRLFSRAVRCLFHPVKLKTKHVSSGLSLSALLFVIGYIQYVHIKESALRDAGDVISDHLQLYYGACESQTEALSLQHSELLCPCLPNKPWLVSEEDFNSNQLDYSSLGADRSQIVNGSWKPTDCVARQRVAIVIPARNRDKHLHALLHHLHPLLQSQHVDYSIYVVDQVSPSLYNKAANMNAAYLELRKRASLSHRPFNCVIFQDVDQLPMDNRNMYTCFYSPLHLGGYRSVVAQERGDYIDSFGGITSLSVEDFEAVNGYSNAFWGWGGEDSNFEQRVLKLNKGISVYPPKIAQTYRLQHSSDSGNPKNYNRIWDAASYFEDGIDTLNYRLVKTEYHQLYTKFYIDLDPLVDDNICKTTPNATGGRSAIRLNCLSKSHIQNGHMYCCHSSNDVFCCGKPLYYQVMFILNVSIHRYPKTWAAVILMSLTLLAFLYVYTCRRRHRKLPP